MTPLLGFALVSYEVGQEVTEQLFKANQPNISLPVPVNTNLPLCPVLYKSLANPDLAGEIRCV